MSAAAATGARTRQPRLFEGIRREGSERTAPRRARQGCSEPGRVTLEERLDAVLAAVTAPGGAECPVCRAAMGPAEHGASCDGCGSRVL